MNKVFSSDTRSYLPTRNILWMSLVISLGFHVILTLSFFFGEAIVLDSDRFGEKQQIQQRTRQGTPFDTLQISNLNTDTPQKPPKSDMNQPRPKRFVYGWIFIQTGFSYILVCGLFLFNRRVMQINLKRRWVEWFFAILGSTIITLLLGIVFAYTPLLLDSRQPNLHFMIHLIHDGLVRDLSLMMLVIMNCHLLRSLYRQRIIAVENEELKTENIQSHYEALKNQMDPHFMFNSLNTLQSLIETDTDEASDYVQKLSSVLRYTLQNKDVETLSDELKSVEAYCSMMKIRYGDNIVFDFRIDPKYLNYKVLPLSVQSLVENAIKHNVISAKQPLVIQVVTEGNDVLRISNAIQPKLKKEHRNGTGLLNLSERYRLQWEKNVEIINDGKFFIVILPLIEN